jgi:6-phosphogluconate dehydrogenase
MTEARAILGIVGLGTMGHNLLLNIADKGFPIAGFDRKPEKTADIRQEVAGRPVYLTSDLGELAAILQPPRAILILVPAGAAVDSVVDGLIPHLSAGDILIDSGNSHFTDTDRRQADLAGRGLRFLGMGISGGAQGARHGPSMMPGGERQGYQRVREVLEAAAARVKGQPCIAYMGEGSAGHYVKMVHNGIEYGLMQLIAEAYDFARRGLGVEVSRLRSMFEEWSGGEFGGYLLEITAVILGRKDESTGDWLVDRILDVARHKGTGVWTTQEALRLQIPAPTIDVAVAMRDLSAMKAERMQASTILASPRPP